ncbi:MAG: hypothetical protein LUE92_13180 [Clostridiales bacterium]|nr:hypothetical protein [Clostridiales bacterium]
MKNIRQKKTLDLTATLYGTAAYSSADFVATGVSMNCDGEKDFFDTSAVDAVKELVIERNPDAIMAMQSTMPVWYAASVKHHGDNLIVHA